jgi:hypothetical protein
MSGWQPGLDLDISRGPGLPSWVNHFAFRASDLDALDVARDRWHAFGCDVVRMRHSHGLSVYTEDPNGNVVEWPCTTRAVGKEERRLAATRLRDPELSGDAPTEMEFFHAADFVAQP